MKAQTPRRQKGGITGSPVQARNGEKETPPFSAATKLLLHHSPGILEKIEKHAEAKHGMTMDGYTQYALLDHLGREGVIPTPAEYITRSAWENEMEDGEYLVATEDGRFYVKSADRKTCSAISRDRATRLFLRNFVPASLVGEFV